MNKLFYIWMLNKKSTCFNLSYVKSCAQNFSDNVNILTF